MHGPNPLHRAQGRHGTTTLFAALNILDDTAIGRCMAHHRHQEFIRFLNAVEREVPAGKVIHAILDYLAEHNRDPKPFTWTKPADQILAKMNRLHASAH
jgi:hypothetical protein